LNIVFLDVWLSHKARHQLTQASSHFWLKQIHELKKKTQNIKEELIKDMEKPNKK
jgi:hypothetical protein